MAVPGHPRSPVENGGFLVSCRLSTATILSTVGNGLGAPESLIGSRVDCLPFCGWKILRSTLCQRRGWFAKFDNRSGSGYTLYIERRHYPTFEMEGSDAVEKVSGWPMGSLVGLSRHEWPIANATGDVDHSPRWPTYPLVAGAKPWHLADLNHCTPSYDLHGLLAQ